MTRVLVAGGSGFIGSHVCEALLDRGDEVICLDNMITGRFDHLDCFEDHAEFSFIRADVARAPLLRVDAILHLASPHAAQPGSSLAVETLLASSAGTHRLLALAADTGARFVYGSGIIDHAASAADLRAAQSFGEALTWAYRERHGLNASVARIGATYGPRMATAPAPSAACYVGDVVEALLLVLNDASADGQTFEIDVQGDAAMRERYGWRARTSYQEGLRLTDAYLADRQLFEAVA